MGYILKVFSDGGKGLGKRVIDMIPEVASEGEVYFMDELYFEMGAKLIDKYGDNKEVAEAMKTAFMLGLFAGVFSSDSPVGNTVKDIGKYVYTAYMVYLAKKAGEEKK